MRDKKKKGKERSTEIVSSFLLQSFPFLVVEKRERRGNCSGEERAIYLGRRAGTKKRKRCGRLKVVEATSSSS